MISQNLAVGESAAAAIERILLYAIKRSFKPLQENREIVNFGSHVISRNVFIRNHLLEWRSHIQDL